MNRLTTGYHKRNDRLSSAPSTENRLQPRRCWSLIPMFTIHWGKPEPVQRRGRRLEELPFEMLSHIASHLSKEDLLSIRLCSNRAIRDSFDDNFVQQWFRYRKLKVSLKELARFEMIVRSRFAAQIQHLEVELCSDVPITLRNLDSKMNKWLVEHAEACTDVHNCKNMLCDRLTKAFRCMTRLNQLVVCAPKDLVAVHEPTVEVIGSRVEEYIFSAKGLGSIQESLSHLNIPGYWSPRTQFHSIVGAIAAAEVQLKHVQLCNFAKCSHTALFAPATPILRHLVSTSKLRTLVTVDLDLDIVSQNRHVEAIVVLNQLLQHNPHLKNLALDLLPRPGLTILFMDREVACSRLLACLGSSPPFSLRSLYLRGLYAVGYMTLDRVIAVHSSTFEVLSLDETKFDTPNRFRSLLAVLLDTQLECFVFREFVLDHTYVLKPYKLSTLYIEDDDPLWTDKEDTSYRGWAKLTKDLLDDESEIQCDYRDWTDAKTMMKETLGDLIVQIDTGAMGPGV